MKLATFKRLQNSTASMGWAGGKIIECVHMKLREVLIQGSSETRDRLLVLNIGLYFEAVLPVFSSFLLSIHFHITDDCRQKFLSRSHS